MGISTKGNLFVEDGCSPLTGEMVDSKGIEAGWIIQSVSYAGGVVTQSVYGTYAPAVKLTSKTLATKIKLGTSFANTKSISMDVAEVLVYSHSHTAAERNAMLQYLKKKYKI